MHGLHIVQTGILEELPFFSAVGSRIFLLEVACGVKRKPPA